MPPDDSNCGAAPASSIARRLVRRWVVFGGVLTAGAIALAGAAAPANSAVSSRVVLLPPFVVGEEYRSEPWAYGRTPHDEILSLCSYPATENFLRSVWQLDRCLDAVVPPEFQVRMSAPRTFILYDQNLNEQLQQAVTTLARQALQNAVGGPTAASSHPRVMPNLELADEDSLAIYCQLGPDWEDVSERRPPLSFTTGHIRSSLRARRPALPEWFVEGVLDLFNEARFTDRGPMFPALIWIDDAHTKIAKERSYEKTATSNPVALTDLTENLASDLLPPAQMLAGPPPEGSSPEAQLATLTWRSEAALFVRWAVDVGWGVDAKMRADQPAFWKFIARSSAEPPTEEMFQECFGFDYGKLHEKLGRYLVTAIRHQVRVAVTIPRAPDPKLRRATPAEIGRIKGDWERRTVGFVRTHAPDYVAHYADQAHRTLTFPYNRGERDPGLLGMIGEFHFDQGNAKEARPLLEAAIAAAVAHPRIYYALARIRYDEATRQPAGPNGKLSDDQIAGLDRLFTAMNEQSPPILKGYELMVQAWAQALHPPPPAKIRVLDDGARLFRSPRLMLAVAVVEAAGGQTKEARSLIQAALLSNPDAATKDLLTDALARLTG